MSILGADEMRLLVVGSINWDDVWSVPGIVRPGQTLASSARRIFTGGKGLNQSIAAASAGCRPLHLGTVGLDGQPILEWMKEKAVDTSLIRVHPEIPTGRAFIQVDSTGQNAIVIDPGANSALPQPAPMLLAGLDFPPDPVALIQNETAHVQPWIQFLSSQGFRVIWNPAPAPQRDEIRSETWESIHTLVVNEEEACALGGHSNPPDAIQSIAESTGIPHLILTRGTGPVIHITSESGNCRKPVSLAVPVVHAVDTTAAGDTFCGYLAAGLAHGRSHRSAIHTAIHAASLSTTRPGAAPSIPDMGEVLAFMEALGAGTVK